MNDTKQTDMEQERELNLRIARLAYPNADVQVDERLGVIVVYQDGKRPTFPWYTRSLDSCVGAMPPSWGFDSFTTLSTQREKGKYHSTVYVPETETYDRPFGGYGDTREMALAIAMLRAMENEKHD